MNPVKVTLKPRLTLRRFFPGLGVGDSVTLEVAPGTSLGQLLGRLGIPREEVMLLVLNGTQGKLETPIVEDSEWMLLPPISGG